ncbi:MAG: hypothetical protein QOF57_1957 [Frankiaceae bacterium]|nr:hypothetical protein [Frankiaceae bacterium]
MTDAQPWIDALRNSHERLAKLVAGLDADDVRSPSYAKEWTIADVLSHLGSGAEHHRLMLDAALTGGEAPGGEQMQPIWDRWNAKSPDEKAADVIPTDAATVQRLLALTDAERASAHLTWIGMEFDLAGVVGTRLAEHAVHTWDVAVMREPGAVVSADAVSVLIDTVLRTARWAAKPSEKAFTLAVTTTEPAREFTLRGGETPALTAGATEEADGSLTLSAEQLIRLVYGRLDDAEDAVLAADGITFDDLRTVFPGF